MPESGPTRPADDLRARIAAKFAELDVRDWGYDHGFDPVYGRDPETDAFVNAAAAEIDSQVSSLRETEENLRDLLAGWVRYGDRKKAERREQQDAFRAALGLDEFDRTRHIPQLIEKVADLRAQLVAIGAQRDDAEEERTSMIRDLHAAQFDGATSLPDRPLDTVWNWLLDLVREDRARLSGGNTTFSVPAMSLPPMTAGCAGCDGFRPIGHVPPCTPPRGNATATRMVCADGPSCPEHGDHDAEYAPVVATPEPAAEVEWAVRLASRGVLKQSSEDAAREYVDWHNRAGTWTSKAELVKRTTSAWVPAGAAVPAPADTGSIVPPAAPPVAECKATEGGMGVECHLAAGHDGWHDAHHTPFTDGTESIGYPFDIQWPRNEWDRCAPPAPAAPAGGGDTATEEREDAEDRAAADAIVPGRFGCVLVGIKPEWTPGDKAVWRIDADAPGEPVEVVKVVGTTALVASGDHRYTVDTAELSPPALPADTAHERTEP